MKPKQEQPTFLGQVLNISLPRWPGASQPADNDALSVELCAATTTTLAYYGDPRTLCRP